MLDRLVARFPLRLETQRLQLALRHVLELGCRRYAGNALPHFVQLRRQALLLALDVGELVPDDGDLALEQTDSLTMLGGKLLSDPSGLRVTDAGGESAAPLRVREVLAFARELMLRGGKRLPALARGDLELHQGVVESRGLRPAIRPGGEQPIESSAQFIETHRSNVTPAMYLWESSMRRRLAGSLSLLLLAGCSGKGGNYGCGFAAVAGQSMLLDQFTHPGTVVSTLPVGLPEALPVRIALGPAFPSIVGRADTMIVVGVQGTLPATPVVGFGVLVLNPQDKLLGVLLYEGVAIRDAPVLGSVNVGGRDVPLIGIRLDLSRFEKPSCPIFPDSLRK